MDDFNKLLNEELENPEFKQEWEKLESRKYRITLHKLEDKQK